MDALKKPVDHQTNDVKARDSTGTNKHEAKDTETPIPKSSSNLLRSSSNASHSSSDTSSLRQGGTKRSLKEANDIDDDDLSTAPASTESSTASSKSSRHVHKRQRSDDSAEQATSTVSGASSEAVPLDRPVSSGKPLVWADNRTELCETLPYYQAYRSAAHTLDGYVRGLMLDKDEGGREYIGTEVLIVRGGGGMGVTADGRRDHTKDHSRKDSTAVAFLNNMKHNVPVNVILGNKNKAAPSAIPHRYCVMDYFKVTDTWCEKVNGFVVIFYRLEKLFLDKKSWWAPVGSPETPTSRDFEVKALRKHCVICNISSPQVYDQGWMCLNSDCSTFWTFNGDAATADLTHNSAFLDERSQSDNLAPPYLLKPDSGNLCLNNVAAGITVSKAATKGVVCENCNRCIPRKYWNAWKCATPGCGYVLQAPRDVLSASQVRTNLANTFDGPALSMDKCDDSIQVDVEQHGLYRLHRYHLAPGNTVTHIFSCETLNSAIGGPSELFMNLQKADLGLQRFEMSQSMSPGQLVAHFSSNSGLPYKYVVAVDSKAFVDVPPELLNVLKRGSWASKLAVPGQDLDPFNEILTVGYLETDKMGYHDDGEATVGPTVVSLSLGGDSEMKFRMKAKFYYGMPKRGDGGKSHYNPNLPIIPGCAKPEERRRLNTLAATCTPAELAKEAKKAFADCKATPPPLLNLKLAHGDIVVQHGGELQAHYEHCAVPSDKLRFALTARHIKPEGVAQEDLWKGELPAGFDDPANAYDGDMALYEQYLGRLR